MDVATRKRVMSASMELHAGPQKIQPPLPEPPSSIADILIVHVLNALNITEPTQRLSFIEDMMSRLQWLKQYHQNLEPPIKKPTSDKPPFGSPRHPELHKPLDLHDMKRSLQKDQDMLQNMSKLITLTAQSVQPPMQPPLQPPAVKITAPEMPKIPEAKKSPTAAPPPPPSMASLPTGPGTSTPFSTSSISANRGSIMRKLHKKEITPPPPPPPAQLQFNPAQQFNTQSAEEMMLDLQEKQRKLLSYISVAHGGTVTDEVLHEYLRHPYVLLRENGVTRKQPNPFFHLMSQNQSNLKMMPPTPSVILKPNENSKPATPIPAPPVLIPQVDLPAKKETSPPAEKVSPPPQLPPQLPLQVPLIHPHFDPSKFAMPVTRACNQWSVVSMALPLTLMCVCHQIPCRCKPLTV